VQDAAGWGQYGEPDCIYPQVTESYPSDDSFQAPMPTPRTQHAQYRPACNGIPIFNCPNCSSNKHFVHSPPSYHPTSPPLPQGRQSVPAVLLGAQPAPAGSYP
jgi:hypothetical protein